MNSSRTAFFVSDRTGITAEMLGHSLLTQFEGVRLKEITVPFIDSAEKALGFVRQVNATGSADGVRPIVVSTLVNTEIAGIVATANALFLDSFEIFIAPLEKELGVKAAVWATTDATRVLVEVKATVTEEAAARLVDLLRKGGFAS